MSKELKQVSMNGRMAYIIMCVEAYLKAKYPDIDWSLISKVLWKATNTNWGDWTDLYSSYIPDVLLQYDSYNNDEFGDSITEDVFDTLHNLYSEIIGNADEVQDSELNIILNKPFNLAMVYEGTTVGDGKESLEIIEDTEKILAANSIKLPDSSKVAFSKIEELNGWGFDFDGLSLSIILNT